MCLRNVSGRSLIIILLTSIGVGAFFLVASGPQTASPAGGGGGELSLAQLASLRGAVAAALPAVVAAAQAAAPASVAAAPAAPPGPLLLGRPVRWGCDMKTAEARAASTRVNALLPLPGNGESPPGSGIASVSFERRLDVVRWVAALGYTGKAVELGVKQGLFAEEVLSAWPGVSEYYLVDPWVHQADYADIANVPDDKHSEFMTEALARTAAFSRMTRL